MKVTMQNSYNTHRISHNVRKITCMSALFLTRSIFGRDLVVSPENDMRYLKTQVHHHLDCKSNKSLLIKMK
jgi:hypothetical protein